jgi:hypothetical protein
MACLNNLKVLAFAVDKYREQNKGVYPSGTTPHATLAPEKRLSWVVSVLPYLEQEHPFKKIDLKAGWDAPQHKEPAAHYLWFVYSPSYPVYDNRPPWTTYIGLAGVGADAATLPHKDARCGMFGYDRRIKIEDITDGTSNTLMLLETGADCGPWASGGPATVRGLDPDTQPYVRENGPFAIDHRDRRTWRLTKPPIFANSAFADGSVRALSAKTSAEVIEKLATIVGGETVEPGELP